MSQATNSIPAALAQLESELASGRSPAEISQIGDPFFLDFLFQIEVRRLVRMGPGAEPTPAELLAMAQRLAATGGLPVSAPVEIRRLLGDLAESLRQSGAWRTASALWWDPLAEPSELEAAYESLEALLGDCGGLPSDDALAESFRAGAARRWLQIPGLLPAPFCRALHRQLEAAFAAGDLDLEVGAVGAAGRLSASRADAVRYLSGLERELLERQPRLAVLAQWCLARLIPQLADRLPGPTFHPPITAMLARYPGPSGGYRAHFDNPGGSADNGRELAMVLYLNPPEQTSVGGELALWNAGASATTPPSERLAPTGGSAALMDSRSVLHQVLPLAEGPARWSLALWLNRAAQRDFSPPPLPELSLTDALLAVESPPVSEGRVLWHELNSNPAGTITVRRAGTSRPRTGIVSTVYGGGTDLDRWCRHHLALGFDHVVLVFDRLEEQAEAEAATRLAETFPASRLTIWSGAGVARERWPEPAAVSGSDPLPKAFEGSSPQAVATRQTFNATAALRAAATEELGGARLDWLLHLDGDELFYLEGQARGGADLGEHFATLSAAGVGRVRYLNHELLLPTEPDGRVRFKRNPRLAEARLGSGGWQQLAAALRIRQSDPRPYFNGYLNGKSAVSVPAGLAAAGVHGWRIEEGVASRTLAGPAVLHFHFASAERYWRKNLEMADADPGDSAPFEPCRTELEGIELVRSLRSRNASDEEIRRGLAELRNRLVGFTSSEIDLLEEAGLVFEPVLEAGLAIDEPGAPNPVDDPASMAPTGARRGARAKPTAEPTGTPAVNEIAAEIGNDVSPPVLTVGILGGGTAGYLTALALHRKRPDLDVTLIASSEIPIIGVGEATTPLMPQFLHVDLGLDVNRFFREVQPTLKLGIRFDWAGAGGEHFNYPFGPMRLLEAQVHEDHVRNCSLRSVMMTAGVAPLEREGNEGWVSGLDTEIGYHLDNERFVRFLRAAAEARGIERLSCTVSEVRRSPDRSRIEELVTDDGRQLSFDLYIDCSGFRSVLLGEALGSPFVSYEDSLFTDRAVVARVANGGRVAPYTGARKMGCGWCWSTPQRDADHLGYVFSSSFTTPEAATAEMRAKHPGMDEARIVRFRAGRRQEFWKGNVFALGNAFGFVEPLESTALHMLVRQIGLLLRAIPVRRGAHELRQALNREVNDSWDYLCWFLALHYRFDRAPVTPFWEACARDVDVSRHGELIEAFREHGPLSENGTSGTFDYPDPLWGPEGIDILLMGQGVNGHLPRPAVARDTWRHQVQRWQRLAARAPRHELALQVLDREPRLLERFVEALEEAGPAFPG